ncbi:hypothetical protein PPYR_07433 [Photinus pyralis]|uniref:Reverse transcriptase domain-containing protein n=1 Tax=Photinus pyralis TaxID=7054 RepID=A0A5N4AQL2_PHOPY|nr:hypothetical protein PPYR_07433 [Photinus pyralis]
MSTLLKNTIAVARASYFTNLIANSQNKPKAAWEIIKQNTKSPKLFENIKLQLDRNNTTSCPNEIASLFNKHFSDTAFHISSNLSNDQPCFYGLTHSHNSFFLSPVTHQETADIIQSLSNKCSTGVDDVCLLCSLKNR